MASLKEIRSRILSVSSTKKITSAMKMVSAAKLKKAQNTIESSVPYLEKLNSILRKFVSSLDGEPLSAMTEVRDVKRTAIIAVSSNSSLCGAFNNNAIKQFMAVYAEQTAKLGEKNVVAFPIGQKMKEAMKKKNIAFQEADVEISEKMDYDMVSRFMSRLIAMYSAKEIDKVVVVYNHFKNAGTQVVRTETLLPFSTDGNAQDAKPENIDYIVEPNKAELIDELIPKCVRLQLYTVLLDSFAAEHGARTTAMQIATDNAEELEQELTLNYNKLRQAAITNEIITITGGAEAIK